MRKAFSRLEKSKTLESLLGRAFISPRSEIGTIEPELRRNSLRQASLSAWYAEGRAAASRLSLMQKAPSVKPVLPASSFRAESRRPMQFFWPAANSTRYERSVRRKASAPLFVVALKRSLSAFSSEKREVWGGVSAEIPSATTVAMLQGNFSDGK